MNTCTHRTIYNHARGCLMAVAESAKTSGKASGGARPRRTSKSKTSTCRKARSALCSGSMWLQANQGAGCAASQMFAAAQGNKITADLPASKAADELAKQPGMGWINDIKNDPALKDKVNWKKIDEAHKNWSYDKTTMTPEMAAVVSLAVAYATGGAGSSILNAGMSTLASQATVSFINNGGDLSKVLNDLGSSQSVKGLVTSMVTAGVLQGLPNYLPTELQGVMNATAKSGFTDLLAKNLINNAASAVVNSAINGTSLEESLKTSIVSAIITTGMAKTANTIGDAASGKIEGVKLDEFGKSVAHAVAGCVAGTAKAGSGDGCTAGAVGAVVGELAAGFYNGDTGDGTGQPKADTVQFAALISGVAGALVGGDAQSVNIAASTGANAAANNYLNHNKPSLMRLSEKEQYERAVAECTGGNSQACDLKTNLAALSTKRDAELKDACSGSTPDLCNAKAKEAYAMGNIVSGSNGGFVFANSPESGVIRGLNTATIAPVTRPNSFNDSVSKSTSEAVLGLTCTSSVICRTALEGVGVGYVLSVAQNKPYTKADVVGDVVGGIVGLGFGNVLFGGVYKSTTALGGAAQFWIKQGADYSSGQAVSGALQSNVPASNNIAIPNISPIVIPNPWDYLKGQK